MPTRVEPFSDKRSTHQMQLFNILEIFLRVCGFYIALDNRKKRTCSKCAYWAMIIYCVFCNLCSIFVAFRYPFGNTSGFQSVFTALPYYIFYAEVAYLTFTLSVSLPKHFPAFVRLFYTKKEKYPSSEKYTGTVKRVTICSILFTVFLNITTQVVTVVGKDTVLPTLQRFDTALEQLKRYNRLYDILLDIITKFFGTFCIYVLYILYNTVNYCIYKEFALYAEKFKAFYQRRGNDFELKLQQLWDEHLHICDTFNEAQAFLKHYVSITYIANIPIMCFQIFGLIKGQLSVDELGFMVVVSFLSALQLTNVTLVAVFIHNKAHEPLQIIHDTNGATFPDEAIQKISLFASRLSTGKIGYSVYGLFTVDTSTITMVCGTLLTYTVVVLQL